MKKFLAIFAFLAIAAIGVGRAQTVCTTAAPCTVVPTASTIAVTLSWNASATPGVTYAVYRSPQSTVSYIQINTSPVTTLGFTDSTVLAGSSYNYFVEAVLSGVNSVPSNIAGIAVPLVPGAPSNLTGTP
jgi:beta-galactosidase